MIFYYLATIIFALGLIGSLTKKDLISILLCVELMLSAVNLFFVLFAKSQGLLEGQLFVFFIVIVAAAEGAVGIALILSLFKKLRSIHLEKIKICSN